MTRILSATLLVLFLLFVFCSTFSISFSQMALVPAVVLFILVAVFERHQPFNRLLRWFYIVAALYVGWVLVRSLLCDTPWDCLKDARDEWLFVIVPLTVYVVNDRRRVDGMALCLSAGMILVTGAAVVMLFSGGFWGLRHGFEPFTEEYPRLQGLFSNALTFGNYVATAAVFLIAYVLVDRAAGGRWRWVLWAGGTAGIMSTVLSNSRGPILALLVGLILIPFMLKGKLRWIAGGVLAVALMLVVLSPGTRERFSTEIERNLIAEWPGSRLFIWEHSWQVARDNLAIGVGPGKFASAYMATLAPDVPSERRYTHAHCDLLNILAVFGIPGLLTFALLWLVTLGIFWNGWRRAGPGSWQRTVSLAALLGSLTFLVAGLTEATFVDEEVRALLLLIWGVGLAARYKRQDVAGGR